MSITLNPNRLKSLAIIILVMSSTLSFSQGEIDFPGNWAGIWSGDLEIYSGPNKVNSIPMKLEIGEPEADGGMRYHILYGADSTGLRPYTLIPSDPEKGKYILDENNGIKIEMNLAGNKLSSVFEVTGSLIVTHTSLQDSIMEYSIYAGKFTDPLISGEIIHQGDTMPKVQSWSIPTMQKAILKKVKM